ncbi:MAG: GntR family transcriptional regulator, partial [Actinocrinis sp.]
DLERKGLAVGRPGQGTFIAATLGDRPRDHGALLNGLVAWMESAENAGLDADGMVALFTSALHEFRTQGSGAGAR